MAVLVLFKRAPHDAACWPALQHMLKKDDAFGLKHCLVFDNSPNGFAHHERSLPDGFELHCSHENVGTAGAYAFANSLARARNCDWLLLLDQDTDLPQNYLAYVSGSSQAKSLPADVIVPRVWHKDRLISPSMLTSIGSIRPIADLSQEKGIPTAISSGVLVRTRAMEAVLPFPEELWLDYVDHWMFYEFASRGLTVKAADVDLKHDLSIENLGDLEASRLCSILQAEAFFFKSLGVKARLTFHTRLLLRAIRYIVNGENRLAAVIIKQILKGFFRK